MPDAVMVTSSFLPGRGGIESYLAELCGHLAPRIAVLAPARRNGEGIPGDLPYPVHGYGGGSLLVPGPAVAGAIEAVARHHGVGRVLFGTPWPLALLGPRLRRRGLSYAIVVHGAELMVPGAIPAIGRWVARGAAGADALFAVSNFTGSRTAELVAGHGLSVPPISCLRARVDLDRFRPDVDTAGVRAGLGLSSSERIVLTFGRLVRRKGIDRLIRALPAITNDVEDVALVVAGTGPEEKRLKRLAARTGGRVVFAGRVPDERAPALYAAADVFALPVADRYRGLEVEGLGVVLLEAAACGTPCVTGRSGGTPEAVIDGRTGYVIDAADKSQLVASIVNLLTHPEVAREMGAAARRHVGQEFFADSSLRPLLAWLDQDVR